MIVFPLGMPQDSIQPIQAKNIQTAVNQPAPSRIQVQSSDSIADTTSVCKRNSIADVNYSEPGNAVFKVQTSGGDPSILFYAIESGERSSRQKEALLKSLRDGQPVSSFRNDWISIVLIAALLLFTLVRSNMKKLQRSGKIIQLGSKDRAAIRETGGLFQWQSFILNLSSFFIISLFCFIAASKYNVIPEKIPGILLWGACLGILIAAFTMRHIICLVAGQISEQPEIFNEYLGGIYQSYRAGALILFILVILVTYTVLLPSIIFLVAGAATIVLMYLYRTVRLFLIFLNRNVSIFYLILYLCALEILPVAIAIKYFTGRV